MWRTSSQGQLAKLLLRKQDSAKDRKAILLGPDRAPLWSKTQNTHCCWMEPKDCCKGGGLTQSQTTLSPKLWKYMWRKCPCFKITEFLRVSMELHGTDSQKTDKRLLIKGLIPGEDYGSHSQHPSVACSFLSRGVTSMRALPSTLASLVGMSLFRWPHHWHLGIVFLLCLGDTVSHQTAWSSGSCNLSTNCSKMFPEPLKKKRERSRREERKRGGEKEKQEEEREEKKEKRE